MKDLFHNLEPQVALVTATIATDTDTNGSGIDRQKFEALLFILVAAAIVDGDYTIKLQHSDDDAVADPYADVPADGVQQTDAAAKLDGTTDNKTLKIGYRGDSVAGQKRWVRMVITSASTTSGGVFTGVALKGHSRFSNLTADVN